MEVKKTTATKNKTSSLIDFSDEVSSLSSDQKNELLDQIGELLIEETLSNVADARSPVDGSAFDSLSKSYAKKKMDQTGSNSPNLDLTGSMLGSLDFKVVGDSIEIGVFGNDAPKADGHNNFSGSSTLPKRQFLPSEGELYTSQIKSLIDQTIETYISENVSIRKSQLDKVESKSDLYELLREELGNYPNKKLKSMVLKSDLASLLNDYDLLELL